MLNAVNYLLTFYIWGGVGLLVIVLYHVGRFYQINAEESSHYRWFLVPFALFILAAIRYAHVGDFAGDPMGDILLLLAGSSLFLLGFHLLNLMMGGR